jgi:hypothetical protein
MTVHDRYRTFFPVVSVPAVVCRLVAWCAAGLVPALEPVE